MTPPPTQEPDPARVLLLVPDGVSARNLLFTGLADTIAAQQEVDVALSPRCGDAARRAAAVPGAACHPLADYAERPFEVVLRRTLEFAHMRVGNTYAMRHNLRQPVPGRWRHRAIVHLARAASRLFASPRAMARLERALLERADRRPEVDRYEQVLRERGIGCVVNAHQRPTSVLPVVLAARRLGIPTVTFIFSWDNLTSKARIVAPFDGFFVWSEHMADELRRFYPDVDGDRLRIVGSPQFDPYGDPELLVPRADFAAGLGIEASAPVICYSGGDAGTCPEDPEHVRILLELIRAGAIRPDARVVLRPSPADDGRRYDGVRADFPELVYAPPAWTRPAGEGWAAAVPEPEDLVFLANLTCHSDVNVNVASTMTLDFALRDRPVVNIGFDVADPPPHGVPIGEMSRRFEHYQPVLELGAARLASGPDELARLVERALDDPGADRDARAALVRLELGVAPGASNQAVAGAVRDWTGPKVRPVTEDAVAEWRRSLQEEEYRLPHHWLAHKHGLARYQAKTATMAAQIERSGLGGGDVLDVGCGDGRGTKDLADLLGDSFRCRGVDFSERAIAFARLMAPDLSFDVQDGEELGFPDGSFDLVVAREVIEHVPEEDVAGFVEELRRVLRPGGRLVVTTPTTNRRVPDKHFQHFTEASLRAALETDGGFEVEVVEGLGWFPGNRRVERVYRYVIALPALWRIDAWCGTRPLPPRRADGLICLAVAR